MAYEAEELKPIHRGLEHLPVLTQLPRTRNGGFADSIRLPPTPRVPWLVRSADWSKENGRWDKKGRPPIILWSVIASSGQREAVTHNGFVTPSHRQRPWVGPSDPQRDLQSPPMRYTHPQSIRDETLRLFVFALLALGGAFSLAVDNQLRAAPQAQEPIVVGEFASMTGSEATFGTNSNNGVQLAEDEINAAVGLLGGRKVRVILEDDWSKAGQPSTAD